MIIRIGTRKSRLAIAQTEMVCNALKNKFDDIQTEIIPITTKGDKILDKPLAKIGGKGIFITEIEQALLNKKIDIAVHSAKDLPAPCQGIIAIESRKNDDKIAKISEGINDKNTFYVFETEKYILKLTGGNCDIPLGAYAYISENKIYLKLSDNAEHFASGHAPIEERFLLAEKLVKEI